MEFTPMMSPEAERIERERLAALPLSKLIIELADVHIGDGDDLGVLARTLHERIDRLAYTTEKPTAPGWYWWRPTDVSIAPEIVSVLENGNVLLVYDKRIYHVDSMIYGANGEWAGPLEMPE